MRVLGTHCYAGGFTRGLRDWGEVDLVGNVESWAPALPASVAVGNELIRLGAPVPQADMVVGNPPCARFSVQSITRYDHSDRTDLSRFDALKDVLASAHDSGASTVWWETGPLAWSRGHAMVRAVHDHLTEEWGACTTLVVLFDLRYAGVPQRRPRTHVIHRAGQHVPPQLVPAPAWPLQERLGEWVANRVPPLSEHSDSDVPELARRIGVQAFIAEMRGRKSFDAAKPQLLNEGDAYAPAVLKTRRYAWAHQDRWFTPEEYAALMTYPPLEWRVLAGKVHPYLRRTLLTKSVAPAASGFVFRGVVEPWVTDAPLTAGREARAVAWSEGIYAIDMGIKDTRGRR